MGDIKRSSSAMSKAGHEGIIGSADDAMFTALRRSPLSGKTTKVQRKLLEESISEAPPGELSDD